MIISAICKRIVDGLWAAGGIGAAAELGYEEFGSHQARPVLTPCALQCAGVRGGRRPAQAQARIASAPLLEGELCRNPVVRKSVR